MKTRKNLIRSADEYTRYYGDFRGVDFSTEHTAVNERRFAYALNMYKDYRSGEGTCVETIPGFRRRLAISSEGSGTMTYPTVYGIHEFIKNFKDGTTERFILIHADNVLYHWTNFGAKDDEGNDAEAEYEAVLKFFKAKENGKDVEKTSQFAANKHFSKSFTFNNKLYFLDGNGFYVIDAVNDGDIITLQLRDVSEIAYVPTVYKDIPADAINFEIKDYEYEQRNLLSSTFKHTYTSKEGQTNRFRLYVDTINADADGNEYSISSVKRYGAELASDHYSISGDGEHLDLTDTSIAGDVPSASPELEITYEVTNDNGANLINKCTVFETFDRRIFLSGNPNYPNHVWWCGINSVVGLEDPTYFGELNYVIDGVENAPVTALMTVADSLAVLKNNAKQDGSIYLHKRFETGEGVIPVTYPSEQGLSGHGCLGACLNFFDDPIFISRLGVEAIGQLSVRLERAVEHRSTLVDAKLANLDLSKAQLTEWNGYLILLVDGQVFMADSRQPYTSEYGTMQYEWYYLDGIGIYQDQIDEYYYSAVKPPVLPTEIDGYELVLANNIYDMTTLSATDLIHSPVEDIGVDDFNAIEIKIGDKTEVFYYVVKPTWDGSYTSYGMKNIVYKAILCESLGSKTGGEFKAATVITTIDDNIYFGTANGVICSFNFDKRSEDGTFSSQWYSYDNRTIYCGVATKMDNCGIPHLTKSTIKKSTVIKSKAMGVSVAKVRVRTNKNGYKSIARLNNRIFSFDDMDFADFSFSTDSQTIFSVREKEKHWVEKQHWIYSDEYQKPFSLNYLAFRYKISGRIKG